MTAIAARLVLFVIGSAHLIGVVWFARYHSLWLVVPAIALIALSISAERWRNHAFFHLMCLFSVAVLIWSLFGVSMDEDSTPQVVLYLIEIIILGGWVIFGGRQLLQRLLP